MFTCVCCLFALVLFMSFIHGRSVTCHVLLCVAVNGVSCVVSVGGVLIGYVCWCCVDRLSEC